MRAARVAPGRGTWPRLPPALVARFLAGHSAVGLVFGALIYLVCLTGSLAVFVDELKLVEAPSAPVVLAPGALDRASANAVAALGGPGKAPSFFITAPTTPRQRWVLSGGGKAWRVGRDGALAPRSTPWTDFVCDLHMTLATPEPWGSALVGIVGVALLSLVVSGVVAHPRILRDAFALRLGGTRRLQEADLHNRISVWGLPFHVIASLTGAFFGLSNLVILAVAALGFHGDTARAIQVLRQPAAAPDSRTATLPALAPLVARALSARPGAQLAYVGIDRAGTGGQTLSIEVTAPGRLPRGEEFWFDGAGRLVGRGRFASGAAGLQVYAGAAQLHFGFYGGLPVRIAYGVLGAGLTVVSATGVSIWLARRRDQGRAAPRLERAWAGWIWGAPAALAIAGLASHLAPVWAVFWIANFGLQTWLLLARR